MQAGCRGFESRRLHHFSVSHLAAGVSSLASAGERRGGTVRFRTGIPSSPAKRETQFSFRGGGRRPPPEKSFFRQEAKRRAPARGARAARRAGPDAFWRPGCTGARRMPWRRQAMKDAASCEKPRGGACGPRSGDVRMGQPAPREGGAPARMQYGGRRETRRSETSQ